MEPPPGGTTGPPDRQVLRLLERQFAAEPWVEDNAFEPNAHEPRLLRIRLDSEGYPPSTDDVRVDVRWFVTGDFSIHYVEVGGNGDRWDRHPNEHSARTHFHRPPDGTDVRDLSLPSVHPMDVFATVVAAITERLEGQWETDS